MEYTLKGCTIDCTRTLAYMGVGGPPGHDSEDRGFRDGLCGLDRTGREFSNGLHGRDMVGREFMNGLQGHDMRHRKSRGAVVVAPTSEEVYAAHTHMMASTITGSTMDSGVISRT